MEARKDKWEQYFEEILASISDKEFDALLKEVEPFSHVGPDVMQYLWYTEPLLEANLHNMNVSFSFERQNGWFGPNPNSYLAA